LKTEDSKQNTRKEKVETDTACYLQYQRNLSLPPSLPPSLSLSRSKERA